jgi:5-methylcytosine-specific restriction endonuclease McrA
VCSGNHKIEVDHIIPIFAGGLNEEKNMQFLCQICHRKKTANDYKLYKRVTK